jgi:hypothetical protein
MNKAFFQQFTDIDKIRNIINQCFFADWGIIQEVIDDTHVKVAHAMRTVMIDGTACADTITVCEILYPNGAEFSLQTPPSKSDTVLLIGLRNLVDEADVSSVETPDQFAHYEQCTMKAIPFCSYGDKGKVVVTTDNGKLDITAQDAIKWTGTKVSAVASAAGSANLLAKLNEAIGDLSTSLTAWATTCATAVDPATCVTAVQALGTAFTSLNTQLSALHTLIAQGTE